MRRPVLLLGGLVLAVVAAGVASMSLPPGPLPSADHAELRRLYDEDQADRAQAEGRAIDRPAVSTGDHDRARRVREILERDRLTTGADYFHAAVILQHGGEASDAVLAHELSMVALALGDERARWLAAATLDRFLMESGRAQRWGTQHRDAPGEPAAGLYPVEPGVTDMMRRVMDVPAIDREQK